MVAAQAALSCRDIERVNRCADKFGDLLKRWDDRLVLEESAYAEAYARRKLAVALIVDMGLCADRAPWGGVGAVPLGSVGCAFRLARAAAA